MSNTHNSQGGQHHRQSKPQFPVDPLRVPADQRSGLTGLFSEQPMDAGRRAQYDAWQAAQSQQYAAQRAQAQHRAAQQARLAAQQAQYAAQREQARYAAQHGHAQQYTTQQGQLQQSQYAATQQLQSQYYTVPGQAAQSSQSAGQATPTAGKYMCPDRKCKYKPGFDTARGLRSHWGSKHSGDGKLEDALRNHRGG